MAILKDLIVNGASRFIGKLTAGNINGLEVTTNPVIASGTNLNNVTKPGWYYCDSSATAAGLSNCPTQYAFFLEVGIHAGVYQRLVEYLTSNPKHYYRNYYSSSWGSWVEEKLTDTNTTYTASTSKLVTTTVPNVTSAGSAPTLGTAIPADDITAWDAGSTPTLGTDIPADDITAWTTNTPTGFSLYQGVLTLTAGSAASLSYTAKSIPNVTSVGSVPSLSYTAKSIPNVTSVGSAPTLGTAITVATGSLASNGGGASVATGITAS